MTSWPDRVRTRIRPSAPRIRARHPSHLGFQAQHSSVCGRGLVAANIGASRRGRGTLATTAIVARDRVGESDCALATGYLAALRNSIPSLARRTWSAMSATGTISKSKYAPNFDGASPRESGLSVSTMA